LARECFYRRVKDNRAVVVQGNDGTLGSPPQRGFLREKREASSAC
jgi:hypothetical protein